MTKKIKVPPVTYTIPVILVNQVQSLRLGELFYLDFRHLHPDMLSQEATNAGPGEKHIQVEADISEVPPLARIALPDSVAVQLRDILNRNFPEKGLDIGEMW